MRRLFLTIAFLTISSSAFGAYNEVFNPHTSRLDKVGVDDLGDITDDSCANGKIIKYNGSDWVCGDDATGSAGALIGISVDDAAVTSVQVIGVSTNLTWTTITAGLVGDIAVASSIDVVKVSADVVSADVVSLTDIFVRGTNIGVCTDAQVLGGTASGLGLECQADVSGGAGGTTGIVVSADDAQVVASADTVNFNTDFTVTNPANNEASVDVGPDVSVDNVEVGVNLGVSGDLGVVGTSLFSGAITAAGGVVGNASTASALFANGANAAAGNAILGVDEDGAAEGAFDVWTEAENTAAGYISSEDNNLETVMTGVAQHEIAIGQSGGDVGGYYLISGDGGLTDLGVLTVNDDSHDHSAAGSTVTINAADIVDISANSDITADLEEETHASEHEDGGADEIAVTAGMMNTGTGADATTFWRGDNTWQTPAGGSSQWTDAGTIIYPTEPTDYVVVGASNPVSGDVGYFSLTVSGDPSVAYQNMLGISAMSGVSGDYISVVSWDTSSSDLFKVASGGVMTVGDANVEGNIDFGVNTITDSIAGNLLKGSINLMPQSATIASSDLLGTVGGASIDVDGMFRLKFGGNRTQCALWNFRAPNDFASAPVVKVQYVPDGVGDNGIDIEAYWQAVTDGDSAVVSADSFASVIEIAGGTTIPTTAGYLDEISLSMAQEADDAEAGDNCVLKICRDHDDTDDDVTDTALSIDVVAVQVEYDR